MTPKEKAKELSDKYLYFVEAFSENQLNENIKQCALIPVDEIINCIKKIHNGMTWNERKQVIDRNLGYSYWQEVKKEIENI
jgi:hypothetical protein